MFKPGENNAACEAPEGLSITGGTAGTGKIVWDNVNGRFDFGDNELAFVGRVPLGTVLTCMPHLSGAYVCTATTTADAAGFVLCGGQTLADPTSPLNGQTIPNINGDVFLMGAAGASGAAGGSNTKDLSHTHSVTSNVSVSSHGVTNNAVTSGNENAPLSHSVTNNAVTSGGSGSLSHSLSTNVAISNHTLVPLNLPSHNHSLGSVTVNIGHSHSTEGAHGHGKLKSSVAYHTGSSTGEYHPSGAGTYISYSGGIIPNDGSEGTHSHTLGTTNVNVSGSTDSTGSASAITHSITQPVISDHASHTHSVTSNVAVSAHASHTHSVTSNVSVSAHAAHTHSVTSNVAVSDHTVTNNAVTSGSSLSSTYDVRPKYITVKYIMRVK